MSGSNMIFIVILVIAVIVSLLMATKNIRNRFQELNQDGKNPADKKEKEPEREDPAVTAAKKELYQYLNQSIKKMYQSYRKDQWENLTVLGVPSASVREQYAKILETLPNQLKKLVEDYFSCLDIDGKPSGEGEEEAEMILPGTVIDPAGLKNVFLQMMLPFYPVYHKEVAELRHTSLLNQNTLELFHRLTGKKYRMGYKNRYGTGVTAFRWKKDAYQVYDRDGQLLCDAVFQNGKVWDGYAILKVEDYGDGEWDLYRKGTWKQGEFTDGTLQYIYKKTCN